jgi:hypothetical protein
VDVPHPIGGHGAHRRRRQARVFRGARQRHSRARSLERQPAVAGVGPPACDRRCVRRRAHRVRAGGGIRAGDDLRQGRPSQREHRAAGGDRPGRAARHSRNAGWPEHFRGDRRVVERVAAHLHRARGRVDDHPAVGDDDDARAGVPDGSGGGADRPGAGPAGARRSDPAAGVPAHLAGVPDRPAARAAYDDPGDPAAAAVDTASNSARSVTARRATPTSIRSGVGAENERRIVLCPSPFT